MTEHTSQDDQKPRAKLHLGGSSSNPSAGSAETVTVACKLPHGFKMRLFRAEDVDREMFGGGYRTFKEYRTIPDSPSYTLNGFARDIKVSPEHTIVAGFGLTHGIPKDFYEEWMRQNKDARFVKEGLIFAYASEAKTIAESREKASLRCGMEPLDPDNLPAQFKGVKRADKAAA